MTVKPGGVESLSAGEIQQRTSPEKWANGRFFPWVRTAKPSDAWASAASAVSLQMNVTCAPKAGGAGMAKNVHRVRTMVLAISLRMTGLSILFLRIKYPRVSKVVGHVCAGCVG